MDTLFCPFCHDILTASLTEGGSDFVVVFDQEECVDVYDMAQEYKCEQGHSVYIPREDRG